MDGNCKPRLQLLEQAITKLREDLLYIQKFKTPLAPVHELNHIGYVLQKLEEEIDVVCFFGYFPGVNM